MEYLLMDLQLFGEGGDGGAQAGDAGTEGANAAGISEQTEQAETPIAGATQTEAARVSFADLIAGDYKDDYQRSLQAVLNDRLKGHKAREEKTAPILKALAEQYGVDPEDLDGISSAFTNDPKRYEQQALNLGVSPETAKRLSDLKAAEQAQQKAAAAQQREMATRNHYQSLKQQAVEMQKLYPGFDLQRELSNPKFFKATSPDGGMSVKEAYLAIHGEEIAATGMQYAVQQSQQKIAAAVAANGSRPREGGLGTSIPATIQKDPNKMTRAEREDIRQRVARGEKVYL